ISIPQAPFVQNDRVYVPVRIISEALGAHVKWNKATQTVEIESSLLTHHVKLPVVNDRDQYVALEHNGNMQLKWSYQDESPFQMFHGYVAVEDKFIFKGFDEAYVINHSGVITEMWELQENVSPAIKAYYFAESKTAKVVSSHPANTWNSIPL